MLNRRDVLLGSVATATALVSGGARASGMESYYLMVFLNPVPGKEREFNTFYDTRHLIDVTAVPGMVMGQRFIRSETQMVPDVEPRLASYLALYTLRTDDLDAVAADILNRIKTGVTKFPTPSVFEAGTGQSYWYRFDAPVIRRTQPIPSGFAGKKLIDYNHMVFMNAADGKQKEWEEWYDRDHSSFMLTGDGVMTSQRTTLARPSGDAMPPATREMVMFTMQMPEGMPASSAAPKMAPRVPGAPPRPQLQTDTRGYTYRQIGMITHEEAVARKAAFKD